MPNAKCQNHFMMETKILALYAYGIFQVPGDIVKCQMEMMIDWENPKYRFGITTKLNYILIWHETHCCENGFEIWVKNIYTNVQNRI